MSQTTFNGTNAFAEAEFAQINDAFIRIQAGASTVVTLPGGGGLPAVATGYGEVVVDAAPRVAVQLPAAYPVVYDAAAGKTTLVGGGAANQAAYVAAGGLNFDFGGGGGVIETASAPGATGNTIFVGGSVPGYVAAGGGADTVVALTGANYLAFGAGANTLFLDGGSNLVGSEGNDQINVGTTTAAAAGSATISLGGSSTIVAGASRLFVQNGTGTSYVLPQTDSVTGAATNSGSVTVFGGLGGGAYYGGSDGGNLMVTGEQATTLVGGGNNDILYAFGSGNDQLQATGQNALLIGDVGSGDSTFFAGTGNTEMTGGSGQDIFVTGSGDDTMIAGSGADRFDITAGKTARVDVIFNFKSGTDQVDLFGYDGGDGAAAANALVQANAHGANGSTYIVLGDNTTLFFVGLTHLSGNAFLG